MKPVIAQRKDQGEITNHLGVGSEDIVVDFVRDGHGQIKILISQKGPPRAVEVSLHKFFDGAFTERFDKEEFALEDESGECYLLVRNGFPRHHFGDLVEEKLRVSVRFLEEASQ